jgi:hypothetical protein
MKLLPIQAGKINARVRIDVSLHLCFMLPQLDEVVRLLRVLHQLLQLGRKLESQIHTLENRSGTNVHVFGLASFIGTIVCEWVESVLVAAGSGVGEGEGRLPGQEDLAQLSLPL